MSTGRIGRRDMSTGREQEGETCLRGENREEGHVYGERTRRMDMSMGREQGGGTIVCSTLAVLWNES